MTQKFRALRFGVPDSMGDVFMPGSIKEKRAILLDHFDNKRPLGNVDVETNDHGLFFEYDPPSELLNLIPAIGFTIVDAHKVERVRYITKAKLYCIGLSQSPNVDSSIKSLSDQ